MDFHLVHVYLLIFIFFLLAGVFVCVLIEELFILYSRHVADLVSWNYFYLMEDVFVGYFAQIH